MARRPWMPFRMAGQFVAALILPLAVAGCGSGGSEAGVASVPPPPPPPPPPQAASAIIPAATASQQFVTVGAAYSTPAAAYVEMDVLDPNFSDSAQLHVRYDSASQTYEIQLPASTVWSPIHETARYYGDAGEESALYRAGSPQDFGAFHYQLPANLQYSALLEWFTDTKLGFAAIGIPTVSGNMPVSGTASYAGVIAGSTTEIFFDPWEAVYFPGLIRGTISLAFNFGTGNLSGQISPTLGSTTLPGLDFTSTVYSTGSTNFSGAFGTTLSGINSFSGRFTGPAGQELIGNFAFPYTSPTGGGTEQAAGAFVGRRP